MESMRGISTHHEETAVPTTPGAGHRSDHRVLQVGPLKPSLAQILRTDYDLPIATQRSTTPPPAPALPIKGGLFRRFFDGFRYR